MIIHSVTLTTPFAVSSRWGGGKSTLWKQIKKRLNAEFLEDDTLKLYNVEQLSNESHPLYKKAGENAEIPFKNAVKRLLSDPYALNDAKKVWRTREKLEKLPPLSFLEHLACLFLLFLCGWQSCKEHKLDIDERHVNDVNIQRILMKSQDARSRRMERNAILFLVFLVSLSPIWVLYWPIYLVSTKMQSETFSNNGNVSISGIIFPVSKYHPTNISSLLVQM